MHLVSEVRPGPPTTVGPVGVGVRCALGPGCIQQCPLLQHQSPLLQLVRQLRQEGRAQLPLRQDTAKPADRGVVRGVVLQSQPHKAAEGAVVTQRLFQLKVRAGIPLRQQQRLDQQHRGITGPACRGRGDLGYHLAEAFPIHRRGDPFEALVLPQVWRQHRLDLRWLVHVPMHRRLLLPAPHATRCRLSCRAGALCKGLRKRE